MGPPNSSPLLQIPRATWTHENTLAFAAPDPQPITAGHTLIITKQASGLKHLEPQLIAAVDRGAEVGHRHLLLSPARVGEPSLTEACPRTAHDRPCRR